MRAATTISRPSALLAEREDSSARTGVSVIVPAYDEEGAIADTLRGLRDALDGHGDEYELIVVNDGSTDATATLALREGATVVTLPENRGYGAALKAGIARARYATIAITDADGTYPHDALPMLLDGLEGYDMVVGARTGPNVNIPALRRPAKRLLQRLASYVAGRDIPDLNSGMRVMRRSLVLRFEHLLPSGFSFTTTITLASLCSGSAVSFKPISYYPRIGESKLRPIHAFDFLLLILRIAVYFNPLRVFLPLGGVFFALGLGKFVYDVRIGDVSESALLGFLGGSIIWAVGLLSDQISRVALRRGDLG